MNSNALFEYVRRKYLIKLISWVAVYITYSVKSAAPNLNILLREYAIRHDHLVVTNRVFSWQNVLVKSQNVPLRKEFCLQKKRIKFAR